MTDRPVATPADRPADSVPALPSGSRHAAITAVAISRRRFVAGGAAAGAALLAGPAAISLAGCGAAAPTAPPPPNVWAPVAVGGLTAFVPRWVEFPLADLPIEGTGGSGSGSPGTPFEPVDAPPDATTPGTGGAWLVRGSDGSVVAYAPWCSHLLCLFDFDTGAGGFLCRCHAGRFNLAGVPIEGPPQRPLWRLETRPTDALEVIEVGWYRDPATA